MSTVLHAVLLVFVFAVFLLVAIVPLAWVVDDPGASLVSAALAFGWMLLVVGVGIGLVVLHDKKDASDCADRGGVWSVTGHYYVKGVRHNSYGCLDAPR